MKAALFALATTLLTAGCVSVAERHADAEVFESAERPISPGWDTGRMSRAWLAPNGRRTVVTIDYAGVATGSLRSMRVTTGNWSVGLDQLVKGLPNPLPSRTVVLVGEFGPDGDPAEIFLSLPFVEGDAVSGACKLFSTVLRGRAIKWTRVDDASPDRCVQ